MKNFDPSKLAPPTVVNPKKVSAIAWQIRANRDTNKVSVQGVAQAWDLENNGVNYSFDDPMNPTTVIMWPVPKDDAKVIKGTSAEGKMTSLVAMMEQVGLLDETEQIAYFRAEAIEGHDNYYNIVKDPNNSSVTYPEQESTKDEPSEEEIQDAVEVE